MLGSSSAANVTISVSSERMLRDRTRSEYTRPTLRDMNCLYRRASPPLLSAWASSVRIMATHSSLPHVERTAQEPREDQLEPVILSNIREINDKIRLLRLSAVDSGHTIKVSFLKIDSLILH